MKELRNAFITGVLVLVPIIATLNLIFWLINTLEGNVRSYLPTQHLPFDFPGLGLLLALSIIVFIGIVAKNHLANAIFVFFDAILKRTPLAGGIYGTIKKFLETMLNPQSDKFHDAVLVKFPSTGLISIGFRTGKPDKRISAHLEPGYVNVFVPCAPNPTSGFYLLVKESDLIPLDIPVQSAFKIAISMGIVTLDENETVKHHG